MHRSVPLTPGAGSERVSGSGPVGLGGKLIDLEIQGDSTSLQALQLLTGGQNFVPLLLAASGDKIWHSEAASGSAHDDASLGLRPRLNEWRRSVDPTEDEFTLAKPQLLRPGSS